MRRFSSSTTSGFTLIEMIVTVAIIGSLAAILVPIVSTELAGSAEATAQGESRRIGTAINQYFKDVGLPPIGAGGAEEFEYLIGDGEIPDVNPFNDDAGDEGLLADFLTDGAANGGTQWSGPYLQGVEADPWGNAYIVNAHGFYEVGEYVWVISAGPNGEFDTGPEDTILQGDDFGILVD